ncbi:hypothetical protein ACFVIM_34145 [Streptomyces sp. NPDC057638]|uniref:hypothetical protein n=1 Tax=Streptomyces sp. NPDC057638 TaxID=3346190 RepID=UPI00369C4712
MPHEEPTALPVAARDEFDMYGVQLDLGDWSYALDDTQVVYGPGWSPFHRHVQRIEQHPADPLLTRRTDTGRTECAAVRISPDIEFRSWRNEYVVLRPFGRRTRAELRLNTTGRGPGATTRRVTIEIDLRTRQAAIPDRCPKELREQAEVKATRILDFLTVARSERRRGAEAPAAVLHPGLRRGGQTAG